MKTVTIPNYTCRGLTWLSNGQQVCTSLPEGTYFVMDAIDLTYTDLGRPKTGRAVPLVHTGTAEKWFVGVQIAEWLLGEHAMPPATQANCNASTGC